MRYVNDGYHLDRTEDYDRLLKCRRCGMTTRIGYDGKVGTVQQALYLLRCRECGADLAVLDESNLEHKPLLKLTEECTLLMSEAEWDLLCSLPRR